LGATSSTLIAITSQPRSLLSIARLNIARSRLFRAFWSMPRIAQTCFCLSGGLAPISLPLFQGTPVGVERVRIASSCMVKPPLLLTRGPCAQLGDVRFYGRNREQSGHTNRLPCARTSAFEYAVSE